MDNTILIVFGRDERRKAVIAFLTQNCHLDPKKVRIIEEDRPRPVNKEEEVSVNANHFHTV